MRRFSFLLMAVFSIACAGPPCFAQSSLFNQGGTGAGGTANQGLGQGGLGQGGLGQGARGQGGLGQGAGAGLQLNELGSVSSQVGQDAFVGQRDTSQFIGARQAAGQGQATTPRFTQARGGGGQGQGFQPEQGQGTERRIRPRYRVAFEYEAVTTAAAAERSRQQVQTFQTAFQLPDTISVDLDAAGVATLRGEAPSAELSRLIAHVLRLEPGVRDVKNELVVGEGATP